MRLLKEDLVKELHGGVYILNDSKIDRIDISLGRQKNESPIAKGMNSMNRRESQLTDNDNQLAAVFVDPKHRILLDEEH